MSALVPLTKTFTVREIRMSDTTIEEAFVLICNREFGDYLVTFDIPTLVTNFLMLWKEPRLIVKGCNSQRGKWFMHLLREVTPYITISEIDDGDTKIIICLP